MRLRKVCLMLASVLVLTGRVAWAGESPKVRIFRLPVGAIQPQGTVEPAGAVHLIYFMGDPGHGDVFYIRSMDGGATFSKPIQVNSQSQSVLCTGTGRGAHIAVGRTGGVWG